MNTQSLDGSPYQFRIVMLAVAAVFDIVHIVSGLFAQQAQSLGAGHVEMLLAAGFVTLHARAKFRF